jgi:hypothetical protein
MNVGIGTTYYDDSFAAQLQDADSRYRVYWTVRVQFDGHGDIEFLDTPRGIVYEDDVLMEKLSLLKMLDVGQTITEVGRRQSKNVYYIRFFEHECMGTGE